MDIAIACAASAVGALIGAAGATAFARDTIRKLKNGIACQDRMLAEAASKFKLYKGWLEARDEMIEKLRKSEERMAGNIARLADERNDAIQKLALAGKPDKQAVSDWARQMQARSTAARKANRAGASA